MTAAVKVAVEPVAMADPETGDASPNVRKSMLAMIGPPPNWQEGQPFNSDHLKHFVKGMMKKNEQILTDMDATTDVPRAPVAWGSTGISWKEVCFKVKNSKGLETQILQNCWGHVPAGSLVALMGPSGCGKSTLLDIIAQKKTTPYDGKIFCNGHPIKGDPFFRRYSTYVSQADIMHESLTVAETVGVDALLKAPPPSTFKADPEMRSLMLDFMLSSIGLAHVKDTYIGGVQSGTRGVSGGQKRRVTLCRGMVAGAQLMFADEPTSGLSATDAETCIKVLRFLCKRMGLTCIVVIHQPRVEVAELFDQLIMLTANPSAYGGSTVYNGRMANVVEYCRRVGYPVPDRSNPVDWMMDMISPGYQHTLVKKKMVGIDDSVRDYVKFFVANELAQVQTACEAALANPGTHPRELCTKKFSKILELFDDSTKGEFPTPRPWSVYAVGPFTQMKVLLFVKLKLLVRDAKGIRMRVGMSLMQSILLGIAYYDIAASPQVMHMQFLYLVMQMSVMGGMQVMPGLVDARTIMKKEVSEALYGVGPWIIVNGILDGLVTILSATVFIVVVYAFGGMEWSSFGSFYLWCLLCILVMDSYFSFIAAIAKTGQLAQATCMPGMLMFMIYNGFLVTKATVPDFMTWALYCSPFYYCISSLANDLYNVPKAQCPGCSQVIANFGFDEAPNQGTAFAVLAFLFVLFRCLQVVALIKLNNPVN